MRHFYLITLSLLTFMGVISCGSNEPKTLASLRYEADKEIEKPVQKQAPIKQLSHEEVRQEYREVLGYFEENLREKIERRIADMHMMESVYDQNQEKPKSNYYSEAIKAYKDILTRYPNSPDNAEVLYQLAKAYDIEGFLEDALRTLTQLTAQYPTYQNIREAYFRMGDIQYSFEDYRQAQQAYLEVIARESEGLNLNAHYMLGWSRYKQLDYRNSIDSFTFVLNEIFSDKTNLEELDKKQRHLAEDSISSMSLALDKVGGAKEIASIKNLDGRNFDWMVYNNLGEYYLSKELYEKSASTFRAFVKTHPYSVKAPQLHVNLIDAYIKGGFAKQSLIEKERYVDAYGLNSRYYRTRSGFTPAVSNNLKAYIQELAGHFHSEGQLHQQEYAKIIKELEEKQRLHEDQDLLPGLQTASISSLLKAADFYQRYVDTFPSETNADEMVFLKAEALFSAYEYPQAITEYERVAYNSNSEIAKKYETNAGYAAIISFEKYLSGLRTGVFVPGSQSSNPLAENSREVKRWKERAVDSMLKFATKFHTDERSPSVLTNAAEYLFSLNKFENAIEVSQGLLASNPNLDKTLTKTAYGLIAHSYFRLENYPLAEENYINERLLVANDSDEYEKISERLAVSIYKNSEVLQTQGNSSNAITQLLKIKQLTPDSTIRATAQYDAAALLIEAKRWPEAIVELEELKANYGDHSLAVEFPRKLAFAYEKSLNWAQAALAYDYLVDNDPDQKVKQEALFLSASMYNNDENIRVSSLRYEQYVNNYSQPFDNRMEALYHLALNHEKLNEVQKQNQWLQEIVNSDSKAGSSRTERSQWLSAWANMKYGDYYVGQFKQVVLTVPIVESIPEKQKWLENALTRYQSAANFEIFEFVTMSSFKIGALYRQFANDLRQAPAPSGLSAEDKKVYASIIEEQALPLDQLAIEIQQANIDRAWQGQFDEWIGKSFSEMKVLMPDRFDKPELIVSYGDGIL
jgi:tetratricopeptide (TPR) repeat protein